MARDEARMAGHLAAGHSVPAGHPAPEMVIERDVPIGMDDGIVLRADVFRPPAGQHPVLLT